MPSYGTPDWNDPEFVKGRKIGGVYSETLNLVLANPDAPGVSHANRHAGYAAAEAGSLMSWQPRGFHRALKQLDVVAAIQADPVHDCGNHRCRDEGHVS